MDATIAMTTVLSELGLTTDPEMASTAARFVGLLEEWSGKGEMPDVGLCDAVTSGPVVIRDMAFHSLCAHHLVPFFGEVTVAYLPNEKLGGLGGIARVMHHCAKRPQLQERLAEAIADEVHRQLCPHGVAVRVRARQMCMELRGAHTRATVDAWAFRGEASELVGLF